MVMQAYRGMGLRIGTGWGQQPLVSGWPQREGRVSKKMGAVVNYMRIQADLNPVIGRLYLSICMCKHTVETVLLLGQNPLSLLSAFQAQS